MKSLEPDQVISQLPDDVELSVGNLNFRNCLIRGGRIIFFFYTSKDEDVLDRWSERVGEEGYKMMKSN